MHHLILNRNIGFDVNNKLPDGSPCMISSKSLKQNMVTELGPHHQRDERPLRDVCCAEPERAVQPDGGAQERRPLQAQHPPPPTRPRRFAGENLGRG